MKCLVAIDGTAGSGKTSVSKGVARCLDLKYLDTGAMYRAVTVWMLDNNVDIHDRQAIAEVCVGPTLNPSTDPYRSEFILDGVDVTDRIREQDVTDAVSYVSAVPEVRSQLVELQRTIVADELRQGHGIVVEGRDIGTVVFPEADVKIYLTADPAVRAQRRAAEDRTRGHDADLGATQASIEKRDSLDSSRSDGPLTQAADAIVVDATYDDLPTVINRVCDNIRTNL